MRRSDASATRVARACAPVIIGAVAFFAIVGTAVLDPSNIGWLTRGDSPAQFIGWEFFRHSGWSLPLGTTPGYGLYLGGSVVYSDSIPILAIPAKLFSPILPEHFQYFGFWLLACFVLQAVFAWLLLGLFTDRTELRMLGTAFFAVAPGMVWRMDPRISQWSLGGQFLVTAALYCLLNNHAKRPWLRWTLLLVAATAIHGYLLGMVFALWCVDVFLRRHQRVTNTDAVASLLLPVAAVFGTAWLVGYTSIGSGTAANGYGTFKATPFALIDPGKGSVGLWSRLIPDIRGDWGHVESFNFLGLGMLLLVAVAAVLLLRDMPRTKTLARKHAALLVALAALTAFALTNEIGGFHRYITIPLPASVITFASMFRASGRMMWPTVFAIMLVALVIVIRRLPKQAAVILMLALIVQLLDTSAGWSHIRPTFAGMSSTQWTGALHDPFWERAAARYDKIESANFRNHRKGWQKIARFAYEHGIGTDVVYLARVSSTGWVSHRNLVRDAIRAKCFPSDTLFILDHDKVRLIGKAIDPTKDLLTQVEGYDVLAPGWLAPHPCPDE